MIFYSSQCVMTNHGNMTSPPFMCTEVCIPSLSKCLLNLELVSSDGWSYLTALLWQRAGPLMDAFVKLGGSRCDSPIGGGKGKRNYSLYLFGYPISVVDSAE